MNDESMYIPSYSLLVLLIQFPSILFHVFREVDDWWIHLSNFRLFCGTCQISSSKFSELSQTFFFKMRCLKEKWIPTMPNVKCQSFRYYQRVQSKAHGRVHSLQNEHPPLHKLVSCITDIPGMCVSD